MAPGGPITTSVDERRLPPPGSDERSDEHPQASEPVSYVRRGLGFTTSPIKASRSSLIAAAELPLHWLSERGNFSRTAIAAKPAGSPT